MKPRDSTAGVKREIKERTAELNKLKRRLKKLSSNLIKDMENERRYIARELHDEIGQALSLMKINLQSMQRMPEALSIAAYLEETVGIIDASIAQVHNMSYNLRPSILDDNGLEAALRWFICRIISRSGLEIKLVSDIYQTRLPAELETTCFRVAQESLTNVLKHAKAKKVIIKVSAAKGLSLSVSDDGVGFDASEAMEHCMRSDSFGLLGMQERVALAGGRLKIDSKHKKGTRVSARFPLRNRFGR